LGTFRISIWGKKEGEEGIEGLGEEPLKVGTERKDYYGKSKSVVMKIPEVLRMVP
jgi:hypothetical protein